jgi:hypothetical protein
MKNVIYIILMIYLFFLSSGNLFSQEKEGIHPVVSPGRLYTTEEVKSKVKVGGDDNIVYTTFKVKSLKDSSSTIINPTGYLLNPEYSYVPIIWLNDDFLLFSGNNMSSTEAYYIWDQPGNKIVQTVTKFGAQLAKLKFSTKKRLEYVLKEDKVVDIKVPKTVLKEIKQTVQERKEEKREQDAGPETTKNVKSGDSGDDLADSAHMDQDKTTNTYEEEPDYSDAAADDDDDLAESTGERTNTGFVADAGYHNTEDEFHYLLSVMPTPQRIMVSFEDGDRPLNISASPGDTNYDLLNSVFGNKKPDEIDKMIGHEFLLKYSEEGNRIVLHDLRMEGGAMSFPKKWKIVQKFEDQWVKPKENEEQTIQIIETDSTWMIEYYLGIGGTDKFEIQSINKMNFGESYIIHAKNPIDRQEYKILIKFINYNENRQYWVARWAFPHLEDHYFTPDFSVWYPE